MKGIKQMAQSPSDKKPDLSALLLPARIFVALPSERTLAALAKAIAAAKS